MAAVGAAEAVLVLVASQNDVRCSFALLRHVSIVLATWFCVWSGCTSPLAPRGCGVAEQQRRNGPESVSGNTPLRLPFNSRMLVQRGCNRSRCPAAAAAAGMARPPAGRCRRCGGRCRHGRCGARGCMQSSGRPACRPLQWLCAEPRLRSAVQADKLLQEELNT